MKKIYTDKEVKLLNLLDAEYRRYAVDPWLKGYKFLNRGRSRVNILNQLKSGDWVKSNVSCFCVRVNENELKYVPSYSFTNRNSPYGTGPKHKKISN